MARMAHRHPTNLNAEHVTHPGARRLLKAEMANCAECRKQADADALADLAPDGAFDSLLRGFVLKRAEQWRNRHSRYPATLHDLAPPDELRFLNIPTRELVRLCVIESRAGNKLSTKGVLNEVELMDEEQRAAVLDDVVDGILDDEG